MLGYSEPELKKLTSDITRPMIEGELGYDAQLKRGEVRSYQMRNDICTRTAM
jgi:hypothetical protein